MCGSMCMPHVAVLFCHVLLQSGKAFFGNTTDFFQSFWFALRNMFLDVLGLFFCFILHVPVFSRKASS